MSKMLHLHNFYFIVTINFMSYEFYKLLYPLLL